MAAHRDAEPAHHHSTRRDHGQAARLGLPAIYPFRFFCKSGGLVSYGIDHMEQVREAASYVDRILRGANPGELPVQLPTKYELVINLKSREASRPHHLPVATDAGG